MIQYKFSVIIIANNEERTIEQCLASMVPLSDDVILVLDNKSNDRTKDIAKKYPVSIYEYEWKGYSETKNFGASKAKHPWVLSIDADEVADENLSNQLMGFSPQENTVYQCVRRTWISDYPVKYCGWYPDEIIRLYNRHSVHWNQNLVHERLEIPEKTEIKTLNGILEHYSFIDENHIKQKFDRYAYLRAQEWITSGKNPSLLKQTFGPAFRFFKTYIIKLGILDGKYGLLIAKNEYLMKKNELKYWKQYQKS